MVLKLDLPTLENQYRRYCICRGFKSALVEVADFPFGNGKILVTRFAVPGEGLFVITMDAVAGLEQTRILMSVEDNSGPLGMGRKDNASNEIKLIGVRRAGTADAGITCSGYQSA